ncbi:hypothetical protein AX16_002159 [Volvariella volvacea WC 439]|nr:hypothetical protein AX16_002159 [Volvariella volvacea WC 439]
MTSTPPTTITSSVNGSSSTYPLIVAQFAIAGHPRRTEHWNIIALKNRKQGRVFELVGNYDTFTYLPRNVESFSKALEYRGGVHVGDIEATAEAVTSLEEKLREIPVVRHDPNHDSQTWVVEALRQLRSDGIVFTSMNEEAVRAELAKDMERWDGGDDTVEERLFP